MDVSLLSTNRTGSDEFNFNFKSFFNSVPAFYGSDGALKKFLFSCSFIFIPVFSIIKIFFTPFLFEFQLRMKLRTI